MAKKEEILYQDDHMKNITDEYQECIDLIQEIRKYNKIAKTEFSSNYEGQAKDMTESVFDEIKLHLDFLESCCTGMKEYVQFSWDTLKTANETIIQR